MGRGTSDTENAAPLRGRSTTRFSERELAEVELLERAIAARAAGDFATLAEVAADPDCPPEVLESLADGSLPAEVYSPALRHPRLPRRTLERLADAYVIDELETSSGEREYLEGGIEEDADELLSQLRYAERGEDEQHQSTLRTLLSAARPGLNKLPVDERWRLAADPATRAADLARLATDKSEQVRNVVAINRSTPPVVIEELLRRFDSALYWRVVDHPNLTQAQLDRIALYELSATPKTSDGAKSQQRMARRTLAQNVSPDTLALIAASNENQYVLTEIACHKDTPPRTLVALCDPQRYPTSVWFEALRHPRLPLAKLEQLAAAAEEWVRVTAQEEIARRNTFAE